MVVASGAGRSAVLLLVISEILTWTLALAPPASAADVVVVSGSAFGEQVDTLDGLITSGPLPSVTVPESDGTASSDSARSACVPAGVCSILRTGPLRAAAQGSRSENGRVEGSASDARVDVSGIVTADLVWSRCASRDGGLSGASAITNVTVGGQLL